MPETPDSLTLSAGSLLDRPMPDRPRRRWWIFPLLLILAGSGWLGWRYIQQQRTAFTYRYDPTTMPLVHGNLDSLLPTPEQRVDSFAAYNPGVNANLEADDSQRLIGQPGSSTATVAVAGATANFTSQTSSLTVAVIELLDEATATTAFAGLSDTGTDVPLGSQLILQESYTDLGDKGMLVLWGPTTDTPSSGLSFRLSVRCKNALFFLQGEIHDDLPADTVDNDGQPTPALLTMGQSLKERLLRLTQRLVTGAADYVPAVTAGVDSDADGLMDDREIEFHTNRNWPDTDGDGFSDAVELENGYDPRR